MIKSLHVKNFTVFGEAELRFGANLNVFVGENGTGKTHLLKLAYALLAASWEEGKRPGSQPPTKAALQPRIAEKLVGVFRPEALGRLARRRQGHARAEVELKGTSREWDLTLSFSTQSKSEVSVDTTPFNWVGAAPAYLPTRELLTIYPGFVSLYEGHYLEFEETWRDTCILLGAPLKRGTKEKQVQDLLTPLERAMGGSIYLDKNGRFYLEFFKDGPLTGRMEVPLVAEGLRKLGMLARLIATGALLENGCLFWDEPEANLNARIIRDVARCIVELSRAGIQVCVATHSLFLLRELEIVLAEGRRMSLPPVDVRYFGLHGTDDGVHVDQGPNLDDVGELVALEESLAQTDRYLALE